MEQIVRAVLRAVEEERAHRQRVQQEQRIAGGAGDNDERRVELAMQQPARAMLVVKWHRQRWTQIELRYNPTELSFDKGAQIAEIAIPGLDAPLLQYVRGQAERLTLELFFDTTEDGMAAGDKGAKSVTEQTDRIYQLIKIDPARHAPPICEFNWNDKFPGSSLNTVAAGTTGNQNRNGFPCIVENVRQKFTLFSPDGVPLRATLTVTLREFRQLDEQNEADQPSLA